MDQPGSLESRIRSGGSFQPPRKLSATRGRPSKLLQQCAGASTKKRGQGKGRCSREDSHEDSADNSKTSRRKWSHAEDVALVNVMVEMVASGVYKCDNGFKPGYLTKVEEALNTTCLNSGIKARPHIESRLKSLKKDWFIVNDMICGIRHGTSGFDFDSTSNMVTAPEDVWEDYLKEARAPEDAFEDVNDVHDSSSTSEPLTVPIEEFDATPTSSRTWTTMADGRGNEAKKKRKTSRDRYEQLRVKLKKVKRKFAFIFLRCLLQEYGHA
ncbi:hypothetical protein Syun_006861 [Stephania yunnanensis]|uniref:Myb/SANT-like domain-containing protein n=1 Tax=Stephania yunnanensis TaxID=152371 RepID=A0AAP0KYE6_9MAGN